MKNKIKLIFLSSSEFGVPILKKIAADARFETLAVITLPDKPKNRGMKTEISLIKKTALDLGIKILEALDIHSLEFLEEVRNLKPDLMVMAAFGKIVPPEFLKIPPHGVLNIHPSFLPKFRGPSPIQSAILSDEEKTGITIMLTDDKMDHGPILSQISCHLSVKNLSKEKRRIFKLGYKDLSLKLADIGSDLICEIIPDFILGKIKPEPQDETLATYTKKITKEDGFIDWNEPAEIIERKVRAYEAWPIAYFFIKKDNAENLRIQVLDAEVLDGESRRMAGEFFEINHDLAIQTGNGILKLLKIKPEGKKEMSGVDFLSGYRKYLIKN